MSSLKCNPGSWFLANAEEPLQALTRLLGWELSPYPGNSLQNNMSFQIKPVRRLCQGTPTSNPSSSAAERFNIQCITPATSGWMEDAEM